jgi:hypothetical protein
MIALFLCPTLARSQSVEMPPISIEREPRHSLAFENDRIRVFHLQLQPNEVTKAHRHASFYAYFSLRPVAISNEIAGHAPVITQLEQGELRTSKGGFNVAERNKSQDRADIFVVQPVKAAGGGFNAPLAIRMHDAGIIEQYAGPTMRAYTAAIASGGRLEEHTEAYDSLVVAITALNIREIIPATGSVDWSMKAGETRWIPRGTTHSETNLGPTPVALIVFELN